MGKKVAIVGSGCSGIGALWALKNTDHEVHLFEQGNRLGGHTNTVEYEAPNGERVRVDTGFIVMNSATYRQSPTALSWF
jgi:predicted NAD/FAD-binding protein